MIRRVVVTGAAGFTGQYLVRALVARGDTVLAVESRSVSAFPSEVESVQCDLTDHSDELPSALSSFRPTHAIHLAALANVTAHNSLEYYRVNVLGTERFLNLLAARPSSLRQVIVASSANIYGNARDLPILESACPSPVNHYAASKFSMECVARTFSSALPLLIVRPFNYTGVGQSTNYLVPKLVEHFATAKAKISLGNLGVARDISDVRYVVDVYSRLMDVDAPGVTTNVCSARSTSIYQMIEHLSAISGHSIEVSVDAALVRSAEIMDLHGSNVTLMGLIGEVMPPPFFETLAWMFQQRLKS